MIRLIQPLSFIDRPIEVTLNSGFDKSRTLVIDGVGWKKADVVIVQRNLPNPETIGLIREFRKAGKFLIYETDDAFQNIPDDHAKAFHKTNIPYIQECAALADEVVVSTEPMAKYFPMAKKVRCIANMLSPKLWTDDLIRPRGPRSEIRIGLVGADNHIEDFNLIGDAVRSIDRNYPQVKWVMYGGGASHILSQIDTKKIESTPKNFDYPTHPARLAGLQLDFALCPLRDDAFNQCISDLKFLEFGFLGVPAVFSDLLPYKASVKHCTSGVLASTDADDWCHQAGRLVTDAAFRSRLGTQAMSDVRASRILSKHNNGWNALLAKV